MLYTYMHVYICSSNVFLPIGFLAAIAISVVISEGCCSRWQGQGGQLLGGRKEGALG